MIQRRCSCQTVTFNADDAVTHAQPRAFCRCSTCAISLPFYEMSPIICRITIDRQYTRIDVRFSLIDDDFFPYTFHRKMCTKLLMHIARSFSTRNCHTSRKIACSAVFAMFTAEIPFDYHSSGAYHQIHGLNRSLVGRVAKWRWDFNVFF